MREIGILLLSVANLVPGGKAGCRWKSPAWYPSLDSAPQVEISEDRLVTIAWTEEQLMENRACTDLFEVGVEHELVERKVCSVKRSEGSDYSCKLDLSDNKHCGKSFGFWVAAVNFVSNRGPERVRSFANTIIEVKCGGEKSQLSQVKSSSCLAASPSWIARPLLRQPSEKQLRISWDLRQLSLSECVTHFLLRFWPSAQFAIAPKPFKVEVGEQQRYGGSLAVEQCNNYTWVLTAVAEGGKSRDVQGQVNVPCPGQPLLKPQGDPFLSAEELLQEEKPKTSQQKEEPVPEAKNSNGNKEDQNSMEDQNPMEDLKEELKEMIDGVGEAAPLVAVAQKDEANTEASVPREGSRSISMPALSKDDFTRSRGERQGLPTLTATNSTRQSLSWSLEPGEEKLVEVERVQISCWEGTSRPAVDPPCCRTEITQTKPSAATLVIEDLQPGTQYSCQGGMLVKGEWLFSPKASRITQPRDGRSGGAKDGPQPSLAFIAILLTILSGCCTSTS